MKEFSFAKDEKVLEISKKIEIAIKVGKAKCKSSVAEDAYKFYVLEMKKYFEKRKDICRIAAAYEMQIVEEIETEEFDLPADYVTTEERFW